MTGRWATAQPEIGRSRSRRKLPEEEVAEGARRAWLQLAGTGRGPERVEVLVRKKKSAVCRLLGPEAAGLPVIAKRTRRSTSGVERAIYQEILPRLPVTGLAWRGMVPADEEFCWLFLEDAGESVFASRNPEHRALAASWLARLHTAGEALSAAARLPERGPGDALERLRAGRQRILHGFDNPELPADRKGLDAILGLYDVIESCWEQVEASCQGVPRTLVHGDFVKKNLRIRSARRVRQLLVFDWEFAGFGFPGQDLKVVDPACYASAVRAHWSRMNEEDLARLFETGRLFRLLAEVDWATKSLLVRRPDHAVVALEGCASELAQLVRARGWSP